MARVKEVDFELDELELDEMEEEIQEEKPKAKKAKKEKKEKVQNDNFVGANELAIELGTEGPKLRAWLRNQYPERQKGSSWKWEKGSKELQEVIDGFKAYRATVGTRKTKEVVEMPEDEDFDLDI